MLLRKRLVAAIGLVAAGLALAGPGPRLPRPPATTLPATLIEVAETRSDPDDQQDAARFAEGRFLHAMLTREIMAFEPGAGGLYLLYALAVPDGQQVLHVEAPDSINAHDNAGNKLGWAPEAEWRRWGQSPVIPLSSEMGHGGPVDAFIIRLESAERRAETFSLRGALSAVVAHAVEEQVVSIPAQWAAPPPQFNLPNEMEWRLVAHVQWEPVRTELVVRPEWTMRAIESAALITQDGEMESQGFSYGGGTASTSFDGRPFLDPRVRLKLRTDVRRLDIPLEIHERPLP